jgi:hypothetical protein
MLTTSRRPDLASGRWSLLYAARPDQRDQPERRGHENTDVRRVVREFAFVDGHWSDRPVVTAPPPRGKARKGQIYVLAEVEGEDASETAERLQEAVADYFYRDPSGSLTSALVRAIQTVNEDLFAENEESIDTDQRYATLCCAVFRGDDVYFALAGRGLGYLIRTDRGERFGRGDVRHGERSADLLGQAEEVDVELHHRTLDQPTAIILCSSGLLDLVGDHSDDALRGRPSRVIDGLRILGRGHRGQRSFRTLVIVPDVDENDHLDASDEDVTLDVAPPLVRAKQRQRPIRDPRRGTAPDEQFAATRDHEARPARAGLIDLGERTGVGIWRRPRVVAPVTAGRPVVETDVMSPPRYRSRSTTTDDTPIDKTATHKAATESFVPLRDVRSGTWHSNLLTIPANPAKLALAVAALLALFFIGYVGVLIAARILQGGAPYTTAMSNLSQAQQREREAMGQSDPLVRRHLLEAASQLAGEALAARPDDPLIITTSARIRREYQAASLIVDLSAPSTVVT